MFDVKDKKENNSGQLNAFDKNNGDFANKGNADGFATNNCYSSEQKTVNKTNSTVESDDYFEFRKALEQLNRELDEENTNDKKVDFAKNNLQTSAVKPEKQLTEKNSAFMGQDNPKVNNGGEKNSTPFTPFADKDVLQSNTNNSQTEVVKASEDPVKKTYTKQENTTANIKNANITNASITDASGANTHKTIGATAAQSEDYTSEYTAVKYANYTAKIDYDCTLPTITSDEIRARITKLRDYGFKSICILASRMKMFKKAYPDVCFCAVIGSPSGEMTENSKCCEIKDAIKNGAKEIDVFFRISSLKDDKNRQIVRELAHYKRIIGKKRIFKLSVDCSLLTEEDFKIVAKAAIKAKADFLVIRNCLLSQDKFQLCVSKACSGKIKIEYADNVASLADINKLADIGAERFLSSKATLLADAVKRKL